MSRYVYRQGFGVPFALGSHGLAKATGRATPSSSATPWKDDPTSGFSLSTGRSRMSTVSANRR